MIVVGVTVFADDLGVLGIVTLSHLHANALLPIYASHAEPPFGYPIEPTPEQTIGNDDKGAHNDAPGD